jgi:uncharacterized protein
VILAMQHDGLLTAAASLGSVVLLLFIFLRSPRKVGIVLLPLFVAVAVSGGLMAAFDVRLNFFNMLALPTIIGMGVDDGVHMYHRYQEMGRGSARYVVKTTGMAVVLTTITTSIGFASLLTANHYGLNSLGLLSVVGMAVALLTTLLVLPAALQWADDRAART